MKKYVLLSVLGAVSLSLGGCFTYERRTVVADPQPVVVTGAPVATTTRVITVLPTGYRTTTVRGATYYTYGRTYYQAVPGGYTVVNRPRW